MEIDIGKIKNNLVDWYIDKHILSPMKINLYYCCMTYFAIVFKMHIAVMREGLVLTSIN